MKPVSKIIFGFSDAENYRRRENKEIFNKFFVRTDDLEKLCGENINFLIGDKGTGQAWPVCGIHGGSRSGSTRGRIPDVNAGARLELC